MAQTQMRIKGKLSKLQKIVLEIRYFQGFVYLDKCGRTINEIIETYPEWIVKDSPNPQIAGLTSLVNGCQFHFSSHKMDFSLEQAIGGVEINIGELEHFIKQVQIISTLVAEILNLKNFSRIGVRTWNIFPASSETESKQWIRDLGLFNEQQNLIGSFDGSLDTVSLIVVIKGKDRNFRLEVSAVERQAQFDAGQDILSIKASAQPKNQRQILLQQMEAKRRLVANPEYASLVDVDVYQEYPQVINTQDFLESSLKMVKDGLALTFK